MDIPEGICMLSEIAISSNVLKRLAFDSRLLNLQEAELFLLDPMDYSSIFLTFSEL
jgi:hypothetical protein